MLVEEVYGDGICRSQLNLSRSKMMYSIPHAERFGDDRKLLT